MVRSDTFFTGWITLRGSFRISAALLDYLKVTNCMAVHLAIHRNIYSDVCILSEVTIDPTVYVAVE